MITLKDQAVKYAIECNWDEAIEINRQILQDNPDDIDSLNRLGFAYMQKGDFNKAKKTFESVLEIDESNPIAAKNVKKLTTLKSSSGNNHSNGQMMRANTFIEEAGKTKTVALINLADKKTISNMQPGQEVELKIKRSKIFIQSPEDTYIGMLPHDVGGRLIEFMSEGNRYEAYLKAAEENGVIVFIRECYRCKKLSQHASFPNTSPQKRLRRRII